MSLLEHVFAKHVHLGTLGELTCIRTETSHSYLSLLCLVMLTKGTATEPRASRALQPHDCH
jgi:hypothetical protein